MLSTSRIVTAFLASAALCVWAPGTFAGIKCWTNKEGYKECGNAVPPEYAQQGHTELNKQGLVVDQQERAKTPEELAAEADELSDKLNISRNRFINDAVIAYSKTVRRELLAKEMEAAAAAIKKSSREVIDEFDALDDEAI